MNEFPRNVGYCKHGFGDGLYCFTCDMNAVPRCRAHGTPWHCGLLECESFNDEQTAKHHGSVFPGVKP